MSGIRDWLPAGDATLYLGVDRSAWETVEVPCWRPWWKRVFRRIRGLPPTRLVHAQRINLGDEAMKFSVGHVLQTTGVSGTGTVLKIDYSAGDVWLERKP